MFKGKVAVITGGAHGIGKCIAEEFLKQRASVEIIDKAEGRHFVGDISHKETLEKFCSHVFKSTFAEIWRRIRFAKQTFSYLFESVRSLRSASVGSYVVPRTTRPAERLSQSEIVLSLRQVCYYSSPIEVRVFSD